MSHLFYSPVQNQFIITKGDKTEICRTRLQSFFDTEECPHVTAWRPNVNAVIARRQIVLRYAEPINGSRDDVAGVGNERGNVMGLMPHPEHAVDPLLGSADGALVLASLVDAARDRVAVTV